MSVISLGLVARFSVYLVISFGLVWVINITYIYMFYPSLAAVLGLEISLQ